MAKSFYFFSLASLLPLIALGQEPTVTSKFTVTGTVRDAAGKPVRNSVVIPLSEFGIPLNRGDAKPATMESVQKAGGKDFVLFTQTDERGVFSLDLPPGKYRIAAQSWLDKREITDLLEKNGSRFRIDGFFEIEFGNEMEAAETFEIKPIGAGTITLTSQEASDMLLISTKSLAGDPALGFMALTGGFWSGLIGGTRMQKKEIVISGLPEGEIQFYSFVNDNNGGMGGVKATIVEGENSRVHLPVIAGWSNGHRTPPPELEDLVKYFKDNPAEIGKLNQYTEKLKQKYLPDGQKPRARTGWIELQKKVASHLQDEYELGNGKKVTLADAWAAQAYHRMSKK